MNEKCGWNDWVCPSYKRALEKIAYGEDKPWYSRLSRKAWGGLGAASGVLLGAYDKISGNSLGSMGDYVRTGYRVAHDNADRMAGGMLEGASSVIPFAPTDSISTIVDHSYNTDNEGYRDLENGVAAHMRTGSQYAGATAGLMAQAKPFAKLFSAVQRPLTAIMRTGMGMTSKAALPAASRMAGAGAALAAGDVTADIWGLKHPYDNIMKPTIDVGKGFWDWASGKILREEE